jgi:hypothetical protein
VQLGLKSGYETQDRPAKTQLQKHEPETDTKAWESQQQSDRPQK